MAEDNGNIRGHDLTDDGFSLESILAEYKGSAYIDGDKKTPSEVLDRKISSILKEEIPGDGAEVPQEEGAESAATESPVPSFDELVAEPLHDVADKPARDDKPAQGDKPALGETPALGDRPARADGQTRQAGKETDKDVLFFENYGLSETELQKEIVHDVEKAIAIELGQEDETEGTAQWGLNRQGRGRTASVGEGSAFGEDDAFEEPELATAARKFAIACNSISLRCIPSALVALFMVILTFSYESGKIIPFGIGRSYAAAACALMIALLVVMILCIDILLRGAMSLAGGKPNAETLILFSCVFSLASGAFSVIKSAPGVLTYCAVSALSLTFAAFGERSGLRAITETLKTAAASAEPYGLQAEYNGEINKSVLKKLYLRTGGFYNSLMHPDVSETAYRYATPLLLAAALLLSVFTALIKSRGEYFLHMLSAMLASAAPFSALLSFSVPFGTVAKATRKSGAAIAGWGGADDICFSDGACITDDDLFPPGTLSFSSAEVLREGVSREKATRYTGSLIIASRSGVAHIFTELLKAKGLNAIKVEDFKTYEGGVGALVRGERVMTGSAAFMNLIGIRIPDEINMKNALYTAFDNILVSFFVIDYEPRVSVQGSLVSIIKWRVKLFFAVRDFNITPLMLEQKFKVSLDDFEFVQTRDSYSISDLSSDKDGRISAILSREGLVPFAEAVTGGRLLKSAALASTTISVMSGILGLIYMFYMCWVGAFASAKPGNLILFMASMLVAVLIVCGYARIRK